MNGAFFYDHKKKKTSLGGRGISGGFPLLNMQGYTLKAKDNAALPILDNAV